MNLTALIGAVIGLGLLAITVTIGDKISNRLLRWLAAAVGLVISVAVAAYGSEGLASLLGDDHSDTAGKAGEYMMYLAIVFFIIKSLFFRKRKSGSSM